MSWLIALAATHARHFPARSGRFSSSLMCSLLNPHQAERETAGSLLVKRTRYFPVTDKNIPVFNGALCLTGQSSWRFSFFGQNCAKFIFKYLALKMNCFQTNEGTTWSAFFQGRTNHSKLVSTLPIRHKEKTCKLARRFQV